MRGQCEYVSEIKKKLKENEKYQVYQRSKLLALGYTYWVDFKSSNMHSTYNIYLLIFFIHCYL